MNPALLEQHAKAAARPRDFRGEWFVLEWQPELASPQRFVVGVAVRGGNESAWATIDHFDRFDCIYDGAVAPERVRFVLDYAVAGLKDRGFGEAGDAVSLGSPQLALRPMGFASGHDAATTARRLLEDVAVIGLPRARKAATFTPVENEKARAMVKDSLRRIAKLDYERIVRPDTGITYRFGEVDRTLNLALWTGRGCGDIVSAWLTSRHNIEFQALKSYVEIETAAKQYGKGDRGLFFLRPSSTKGLTRVQRDAIDRFFDEDAYKFRAQGILIETQPSPDALAAAIYDWARPALVG